MTWTLDLPDQEITTPNSRVHWSRTARCAKAWREATCWLARDAKIPTLDRIAVTLTHWPADRRKRDHDRLVLVAKWCVDGLVDAGVIADDDTEHLAASPTCRIEPTRGDKRRHWALTVEVAS